ncbi:tRNA pseudouridine(13) synthase TruD [Candidatus Woesearchaeota archaeon]|nr:tRNA pseudouridine(13) synthase TruD [Candidatus Woesearchaeota archaeon]
MKLKQTPEDFQVKEINNLSLEDKGNHCYVLLKKKNWTTTRIIETLANRLRVPLDRFHFAGLKDKDAVTEQVISAYKIDTKFVEHIKIKDVELKILGFSNDFIKVGSHLGNEFRIVVRDLEKPLEKKITQVPNYFDDQRFGGSIRPVTHKVGEALVQGNFEEAIKHYIFHPFLAESPENKRYRLELEKAWPHIENVKIPRSLPDERRVLLTLKKHPGDFKKALLAMQKRLLTLCIHAYQSWLFNQQLSDYIEQQGKWKYIAYSLGKLAIPLEHLPEKTFPLTGIEIPGLPELNMRTLLRKGFIHIDNITISKEEPDEVNKGKLKQTLTFSLPKGSYATIVVKTLFAHS